MPIGRRMSDFGSAMLSACSIFATRKFVYLKNASERNCNAIAASMKPRRPVFRARTGPAHATVQWASSSGTKRASH
jgi:hypothetical protein